MKVTADTLTDSMIRALIESSSKRTKDDMAIRVLCKIALNDAPTYLRASAVREAKEKLAAHFNKLQEQG